MTQLHEPDLDNTTYVYDSGLQEMSRNHRVYRDAHTGDEAIIYQPTFKTIPLSNGITERETELSDHLSSHPDYNPNDIDNHDIGILTIIIKKHGKNNPEHVYISLNSTVEQNIL
ncbi:hypothetical protein CHS0354_010457 [Potamilus streckersoni]|uniref:Uncharacterized protein n=1 Tax=Potamilus streckersoni TaxID=2493646 RepID=A0AAE0VVI3_9BIVA|nr:hypothetical protein CHS0354_010457 [Potamilus streckersoni]